MAAEGVDPVDNTALLAEIARRFYLLGESKIVIGNDLGLSRFKVARMLQEALDRGIVTIRIRDTNDDEERLSAELARHLGLREAVVVPFDHNVATERDTLGSAGARYVSRHMSTGDVIGFSWGRTLLPIAAHLTAVPKATFVQLTGVVGNDPTQSPIEIISRIKRQTHSQAKALFAPLFSATAETAASLRGQESVADVIALYDHLNIAVLSVGSWRPRVTQLEQHLSDEDARFLDEQKAIADFGGIFFGEDGMLIDTPLNERRISVSVAELQKTPSVIAVAGGLLKVDAIHAVCCTGLPTCLITTTEVAEALLDKPAITEVAYAPGSSRKG